MVKVCNIGFAAPLGVLLVAIGVAMPIWTSLQETEQLSCPEGDDICTDVLLGIDQEDGEMQGLNLIQHTANTVSKSWTKKKGLKLPISPRLKATQATTAETMTTGGALFLNPKIMSYPQLIFITLVYGYILYVGSNMIGDGSELLVFFKSVAGIVGSVVVPILGAVPDAAMVLFSGLGADAQVQVSTGVGALAGSSVMLLTFPWFIVNMAGSVPLNEKGEADYKKNKEPAEMFSSGVTFEDSVGKNAKIMVITSLAFLIIQIPAFFYDVKGVTIAQQARGENLASLFGLLVAFAMFFGYCYLMYSAGTDDDLRVEVMIDSIKSKQCSLAAVLDNLDNEDVGTNLPRILNQFFYEFDADGSGKLDSKEFELILKDLGESFTPMEAKKIFDAQDKDGGKGDGLLSFNEFCNWAKTYKPSEAGLLKKAESKRGLPALHDDDDEEEDVVPEDLQDQPIEVQQRAMLIRSFTLMGVGTAVVLAFSDPAVNVFTEWGNRFSINSFYVGFLLAPFASNASELLVALGYAQAKTSKKITMAFESLVGAACMNNTFVLGAFFALVYFRDLAWTFKAETVSILIIEWLMAVIILSSNTQRKVMGFAILALYPGCLAIVCFLENVCGWD